MNISQVYSQWTEIFKRLSLVRSLKVFSQGYISLSSYKKLANFFSALLDSINISQVYIQCVRFLDNFLIFIGFSFNIHRFLHIFFQIYIK